MADIGGISNACISSGWDNGMDSCDGVLFLDIELGVCESGGGAYASGAGAGPQDFEKRVKTPEIAESCVETECERFEWSEESSMLDPIENTVDVAVPSVSTSEGGERRDLTEGLPPRLFQPSDYDQDSICSNTSNELTGCKVESSRAVSWRCGVAPCGAGGLSSGGLVSALASCGLGGGSSGGERDNEPESSLVCCMNLMHRVVYHFSREAGITVSGTLVQDSVANSEWESTFAAHVLCMIGC